MRRITPPTDDWRPPQFRLRGIFAFMTGAAVVMAIVSALGVSPRQLGEGLLILAAVTAALIALVEAARRMG